MIHFQPLLGAGWLEAAIFIVVAIIAVMNHIVGLAKEAQKRRNQPGAPRPRAKDQASPLRDEVEEFLRRAANKRQQASDRPQRSKSQRSRKPASTPPQTLKPTPAPPPRPGLRTSIPQQEFDTREFTERASHLSGLDKGTEQMREHMHEMFDHRLGDLADAESTTAEDTKSGEAPTPSIAVQIRALFADPTSVRNAIILNEILTPPEHRW